MEEGPLRLSLVVMVCKLGLFSIYLFIYIVETPTRPSKQKPSRNQAGTSDSIIIFFS